MTIQIFVVIAAFVVLLGLLVAVAIYDWRHGAPQSYIHEDGTVREWDRFGNVATVYPDGREVVHVEDAERGLGPLYARAVR